MARKLRTADEIAAGNDALLEMADAHNEMSAAEWAMNEARYAFARSVAHAKAEGATIEEIQAVLGVSRSRVYQLLASVDGAARND